MEKAWSGTNFCTNCGKDFRDYIAKETGVGDSLRVGVPMVQMFGGSGFDVNGFFSEFAVVFNKTAEDLHAQNEKTQRR